MYTHFGGIRTGVVIKDILKVVVFLQMPYFLAFCEIAKALETKGQSSAGVYLSVHTKAACTCSLYTQPPTCPKKVLVLHFREWILQVNLGGRTHFMGCGG
jgi:hypothetical protein